MQDKRLHASNYNGVSAITLDSVFNYLQSLDYTYNIRGWLTAINDPTSCALQAGDQIADLFSMALEYDNSVNGGTVQYNGNISTIQWNTNINGTCGTRHLYRFSYDFGNRLKSAAYRARVGVAWVDQVKYTEGSITYDLNGNLKTYSRRGHTAGSMIDNLTYTYGDATRPDRLTNMTDAGDAAKGFVYTLGAADYQYDLNGNMTQDNHKGFTIAYNYLNLPQSFTKGANVITMTYTADGEKLSKALSGGGATKNYVSGIEYSGANLEAIYFSEGRCTPNGATAFNYDYTIKDHLGNARENFRANGIAVTHLEDMHYYPFGLLMEGMGTNTPNNDYAYNGKELNEDFGLNLSDYGARWYDANLGRWWSVDPMTEKAANISTFAYVLNNPLALVDPNGMLAGNPFDVMEERKEKQAERKTERDQAIKNERDQASKNAPFKLPKAYYVNEAGLSNQSLSDIVFEAATILSKNGYDGLSMEQVASNDAKRFTNTYPNQMFLAFISVKYNNLDPGNSKTNVRSGLTGVYFDSNKNDATKGWASYLNMNDDQITSHPNKEYAAGYLVAHELTHQMIAIAAHYSGLNFLPVHHVGGGANLLNEGHDSRIPARPITNVLQNAEMIPDAARTYLDKFYLTPSKRIR